MAEWVMKLSKSYGAVDLGHFDHPAGAKLAGKQLGDIFYGSFGA